MREGQIPETPLPRAPGHQGPSAFLAQPRSTKGRYSFLQGKKHRGKGEICHILKIKPYGALLTGNVVA